VPQKDSADKAVRDIRRKTRCKFSAEEKIRIVLEGLRSERSTVSRSGKDCICGSGFQSWVPCGPQR
jgi:transposase